LFFLTADGSQHPILSAAVYGKPDSPVTAFSAIPKMLTHFLKKSNDKFDELPGMYYNCEKEWR